jgi:hypothetical protein
MTLFTLLRFPHVLHRSLMALGLVIKKLVEGQAHIPYRDSKLTYLLQASAWLSSDAWHLDANAGCRTDSKLPASHEGLSPTSIMTIHLVASQAQY